MQDPVDGALAEESATPLPDDLPSPPYYSVAEMEEMLGVIQKLDPPGIGARDLRECLLIQLREDKDVDGLTFRLVDEAFADLIAHRWNDLAKRFGVEPAGVQAAADGLARLDPKPGLKYANQNDGYIIPDLIVEKIGTRYQVFLNDTGMPRLRLSRSYQEIARDKKKMTPENREFIASKMNSANWMIQAIEQRRQTMLKVMNFIVDRQRDFFEKGIEYLKPLTLREVAEVINMHESTVSRVTNEKYVQTPRGVLPLKFFFSSALATASGEEASARSIRAKLQKMVADEDSGKPLTDQQIVASLPGAGHPDRPAHRRQVPGPARDPAGAHAEARMTLPAEALDVSVLVPAKDEAPNLPEFVRLCAEALVPAGFSFEVVIVNDGSRDDSARVLRDLEREYSFLRVVTHRRQRGIADALRSARRRGTGRHLRVLSRGPAVPPRRHSRPRVADPGGPVRTS